MSVTIDYNFVPGFPKLGWLAQYDLHKRAIKVLHGSSVECKEQWMVEGVWDGDFELGEFQSSECFFGSGIRIENGDVYFVASSAMTDRLFLVEYSGLITVSNSLILMLASTGAALDPNHDYRNETMSILGGVSKYTRQFKVTHPEISNFQQVFYENIVISDGLIRFETRTKRIKIDSFEEYYGLLRERLFRIGENYADSARKVPIKAFSTISRGYDSTAVTSMVKDIGVTTCFSSRKADSWIPTWFGSRSSDDGTIAANALGLDIEYLDLVPSRVTEDEVYFLATNIAKFWEASISELIFHSMARYIEENCKAAVVFTAYHGDKIWDVNTPEKYRKDEIIRTSTDGLNLSEIRLKSGFINVVVPFILAPNIKDVYVVSRSEEMHPWRLFNSYDRPIARRIAETAGIPRGAFGLRKKQVASYYRYPRNPVLRKQFFDFLEREYGLSALFVYFHNALNQMAMFFKKILAHLGLVAQGDLKTTFWRSIDMRFLMWVWATRALSEQMSDVLKNQVKNGK
jgi:hypothetical protein